MRKYTNIQTAVRASVRFLKRSDLRMRCLEGANALEEKPQGSVFSSQMTRVRITNLATHLRPRDDNGLEQSCSLKIHFGGKEATRSSHTTDKTNP